MRKTFKVPYDCYPGTTQKNRKETILSHYEISSRLIREVKSSSVQSPKHLYNWVQCLKVIAKQRKLNVIFLPFGIMGEKHDIVEMEETLLLSVFLN